jgi:NADH-quinone oxidoreductase subunit G
MSRCIHCTRCVRFGQEVAGVMELGMPNRGEHSEITTFVGRTVDSELSGNMIDICPVGALTSKPFRYAARTWELSRRKSVSPHDSTGANLVVQIKSNKVMRVVPLENEAVNECWISDRDRFSYEGLSSDSRLTRPMIKQDGSWQMVDWPTALEYVSKGLSSIKNDHGAAALAGLVAPTSTLEEGALLAAVLRAMGSENIDHRLRQQDDRFQGAFGLGRSIASLTQLDSALVIGSNLRKDHPLMAQRLRLAARSGTALTRVHAVADDWLMPVSATLLQADLIVGVAEVAAAVAAAKGVDAPISLAFSSEAQDIANALLTGAEKAILLGLAATEHPKAAELFALARWIGAQTGATVGCLGQANALGLQAAGVLPGPGGLSARAVLSGTPKAVVLLGADPLLEKAEMVVGLTSFRTDALLDLADVLLPIAPFTETSGSFVNAEGLLQSFVGVVPPMGEARPAWKVLRVLANLLELPGFSFDSSDEVRAKFLPDLAAAVAPSFELPTSVAPVEGLQRLNELPIYASDMLVRHAGSLQATRDGRDATLAQLPAGLWQQLGLPESGEAMVRVTQGTASLTLSARRNVQLAEGVVRLAGGLALTASLGAGYAPVQVVNANPALGAAQ